MKVKIPISGAFFAPEVGHPTAARAPKKEGSSELRSSE
jgi:hypothetical protein